MKHTIKKAGQNRVQAAEKDYAHYPPTSKKPVIIPLTEKLKKTEQPLPAPNGGSGAKTGENTSDTRNSVTEDDKRVLNGEAGLPNSEIYL